MATQAEAVGVPKWYWAVAVLALLWMAFACVVYVFHVSMSAEDMAKLPAIEQDVMYNSPVWVTAAYAVAVWAGLAGAIGLLLRRAWAQPLFILSLVGVVVQFGWLFSATEWLAVKGPSSAAFPVVIAVIGAFLIWFAGHAQKRGWIG